MRQIRKNFQLFCYSLIISMVVLLNSTMNVQAGDTGYCGNDLSYELTGDSTTGYVLKISGDGPMYDYEMTQEDLPPWNNYIADIVEVQVGDGVWSIGQNAFRECGKLKKVSLGNQVSSIHKNAFWDCKSLEEIVLPSSLTIIGDDAFECCEELKKVTVPKGVVTIGAGAFCGCYRLESIDLPESLNSIGYAAFDSCRKLQSVVIPGSVKYIERYTFSDCSSLKQVIMEEGITEICAFAFNRCYLLEKVRIPSTVTMMGAYDSCTGLDNFGDSAFGGCNLLQTAGPIGSGANIEYGFVGKIPAHAFKECTSLKTFTISDEINEIGKYAFEKCNGLMEIVIPENVTKLGDGAFSNCSNLGLVIGGKGITEIGYLPFLGADKLTIQCYEGTELEKYAKEKQINYEILDDTMCLIMLDVNGGTALENHLIKVKKGSKIGKLPSPTKFNQCFGGWYTAPIGGKEITENTICNESFTIFAHWGAHDFKDYIKKATMKADGEEGIRCENCGLVEKATPIYAVKTLRLEKKEYTYDGKKKNPQIVILDSRDSEINPVDYRVQYIGKRKDVGTYKVKVVLQGKYEGAKSLSFQIIPKGTKISKLTTKKGAMKVQWAKNKKQVTGYQIQYGTSSSFKGKTKTVTVKSNKTVSKEIKKLKVRKKYYVRIRTYKTVGGKKYYSKWSEKKSIKIK